MISVQIEHANKIYALKQMAERDNYAASAQTEINSNGKKNGNLHHA